MTTASADNSAGRSWLHRATMSVGHYQDRYAIVLVPIAFSQAATNLMDLPPTPAAVIDKVSWWALLGWGISLFAEWKHNRTLCLLDLEELPLADPQSAVDRERWKLKLYHRGTIGIFLVFLLSGLGIKWMGQHGMAWAQWLQLVQTALFCAAYLIITELSASAHRRLAPWCPFCRRGGGGGGDFQPEPEPTTPPSRKVNA